MHVAFIAPCVFMMQQDKIYFSSDKTMVLIQYMQISTKIKPHSKTRITVNLDRKTTPEI